VVVVFSCLGVYTHVMSFEVRVQLLCCDRAGCILGEYKDGMGGVCVLMCKCVYRCHVR